MKLLMKSLKIIWFVIWWCVIVYGIFYLSTGKSIAQTTIRNVSSTEFLSNYKFNNTNTIQPVIINTSILINTNTINTFKLIDYSIINTNPANGIVNNPNNNLFKNNTMINFKQTNYVKKNFKQTIPKTTRINIK